MIRSTLWTFTKQTMGRVRLLTSTKTRSITLVCETSNVSVQYANGEGSVSVTGTTMSHLPTDFAGGHGDVTYYFGVVSSEPGFFDEYVPLVVNVTGSGFASGNWTVAGGFVEVDNPEAPDSEEAHVEDAFCTTAGFGGQSVCNVGESSNLSLFFATHVFPDVSSSDDLARIELSAGCTAGGEFGGPGTCLSSIDPMVDFAPGFDHTGLSLVFSPDPPGSAVPEPGSFALLGSAMAMLFYAARSRRD